MAAATVKPTPTATRAMTATGIPESASTPLPLSDEIAASTPDPAAVGDSEASPAVGDPSGDGEAVDAGEGVRRGLGLALSEGDGDDEDEPGVLDERAGDLEDVTRKLLDS